MHKCSCGAQISLAAYTKGINRKGIRRDAAILVNLFSKREVLMFRSLRKYYKRLGKTVGEAFRIFGESNAIAAVEQTNDDLFDVLLTANTITAGLYVSQGSMYRSVGIFSF